MFRVTSKSPSLESMFLCRGWVFCEHMYCRCRHCPGESEDPPHYCFLICCHRREGWGTLGIEKGNAFGR